jgi:hypothetical protein
VLVQLELLLRAMATDCPEARLTPLVQPVVDVRLQVHSRSFHLLTERPEMRNYDVQGSRRQRLLSGNSKDHFNDRDAPLHRVRE